MNHPSDAVFDPIVPRLVNQPVVYQLTSMGKFINQLDYPSPNSILTQG